MKHLNYMIVDNDIIAVTEKIENLPISTCVFDK